MLGGCESFSLGRGHLPPKIFVDIPMTGLVLLGSLGMGRGAMAAAPLFQLPSLLGFGALKVSSASRSLPAELLRVQDPQLII